VIRSAGGNGAFHEESQLALVRAAGCRRQNHDLELGIAVGQYIAVHVHGPDRRVLDHLPPGVHGDPSGLTGADALGVFDVNPFGVIRTTTAFLPPLRRSSDPVVINVSSGMGFLASSEETCLRVAAGRSVQQAVVVAVAQPAVEEGGEAGTFGGDRVLRHDGADVLDDGPPGKAE